MNKKMAMGVFVVLMLVSLLFVYQGVTMHKQVLVEEAEFHALQAEYFSVDKATRDSAESGSELSMMLVEIQQTPSALMELKLLGVGKILTGIYVLLFGILIALMMMPIKLGMILNGPAGKKKRKR